MTPARAGDGVRGHAGRDDLRAADRDRQRGESPDGARDPATREAALRTALGATRSGWCFLSSRRRWCWRDRRGAGCRDRLRRHHHVRQRDPGGWEALLHDLRPRLAGGAVRRRNHRGDGAPGQRRSRVLRPQDRRERDPQGRVAGIIRRSGRRAHPGPGHRRDRVVLCAADRRGAHGTEHRQAAKLRVSVYDRECVHRFRENLRHRVSDAGSAPDFFQSLTERCRPCPVRNR
jgi:hypothetical protein